MASVAQIEANRRNSQNSTGPRTAAGKASSSHNAVKHGLYASALLIKGEDPAALDALAAEYDAACRPQGPVETALVNELLHADWLLRRMRHLEAQLWNNAIAKCEHWDGADYDRSQRLRTAYAAIDERLVVVQRRISALERSYHRAQVALDRVQSQRPAAPEPSAIGFDSPATPEPSVSPQAAPPQPAFGFVPPVSKSGRAPAGNPLPPIRPPFIDTSTIRSVDWPSHA